MYLNSIHLKGIRDVSASFPAKVWLNHKILKIEKSFKVKNHTLKGFNWGHHEKEAAQLALAICLEIYPSSLALKVYQDFKSEFLLPIQDDSFILFLDMNSFNEKYLKAWQT